MEDDFPWFRRWLGFGLRPVNGKGHVTVGLFFLIEIPIGLLSFMVPEESLAWWLLGILGLLVFFGFWGFALSKTE